MPQDEFISTILAVSEILDKLQRSRVLLDCFWHRVCDYRMDALSDSDRDELENWFFLIDDYDQKLISHLDELTKSITESMCTIERMRREGYFEKL